jgi:hypothetical protein
MRNSEGFGFPLPPRECRTNLSFYSRQRDHFLPQKAKFSHHQEAAAFVRHSVEPHVTNYRLREMLKF